MKKDPDIKLIDITEVSRILGVSTDTLRRWDRDRTLPAIQLAPNGKRRYKKEDIEKFLQSKQGK